MDMTSSKHDLEALLKYLKEKCNDELYKRVEHVLNANNTTNENERISFTAEEFEHFSQLLQNRK